MSKNNLESTETAKKTYVSVNEPAKKDDRELTEEELKLASGGAGALPRPRPKSEKRDRRCTDIAERNRGSGSGLASIAISPAL